MHGTSMHIDKDLVAATATPLVLAILAEGESYGYAILKRVRALSQGELEWTDGMLYPLLHRLRRLGYVTTEWRAYVGGAPGVNGRDVDELEDHLRHQISELHAAGLAEDEAFLVAVKRMGDLDALSREF